MMVFADLDFFSLLDSDLKTQILDYYKFQVESHHKKDQIILSNEISP